jgi:phosphosulfolactate synthase
MFSQYVDYLDKHEIDLVEISDGSYDIDHKKKLEYITELAKNRTVISEVGSKKKNIIYSPGEWIDMMKSELDAGSIKVIAESRESGTIGIYNDDGSVNLRLVNKISDNINLENVIWEAPLKAQQAWFIKNFGANVNLGNISPNEIIPLESLRQGLRGDTFFQFLPTEIKEE